MSGKPVAELANEYGLVEQTIYKYINRSTYYKVANRIPSARANENQKLDADIMAVYFATKRRYGTPKIHYELLSKAGMSVLKEYSEECQCLAFVQLSMMPGSFQGSNDQSALSHDKCS